MYPKHIKYFITILLFVLVYWIGCNTTEPPPPNNGTLSISLTDASCTEAWVELKTNGVAFPININILADGNTVAQLNNLSRSDTTIYIDSLLPNKTYNIQAIIQSTNQFQATNSNKLAVQTLDTTSNNFTWQTFTFGDPNGGSCSLNDVAIIDANNIWAVGEIYMDDSTGQPDPQQYCIAKWNGQKWTLERVLFNLYNYDCTVAGNYYGSANAVYSFSYNKVVFTDGADFVEWDGSTYSHLPCAINLLNGSIQKIWGISSNDFYAVGRLGTIVHFNGSTWQKIESGTQYPITDVWGISNMGSVSKVIAVADPSGPGASTIYSLISGTGIDTLDLPGERIGGIWTYGKKTYAGGIKTWVSANNIWQQILSQGHQIRGTGYNDIIGASPDMIIHFNGVRWQNIIQWSANLSLSAVAVKNNIVVDVGSTISGGLVGQAAIAVGTRN